MRHFFAIPSVCIGILSCCALHTFAQEAVYRCGNEYTNDERRAKVEKCKLLASGPIVSVPAHQTAPKITPPSKSSVKNQKDTAQIARDNDAKAIIASELKKTESQLAELRRQYDALNTSADVDRKLALKQQIARAETDISSLNRELKR